MTDTIATRKTSDNVTLRLHADGMLTLGLLVPVRGCGRSRSEKGRQTALTAGWLVMGAAELYSRDEIPTLLKAARWAAERDGLPGTMRARFAHLMAPRANPHWTVLSADRNGTPTERVWVIRLGPWSRHAVFDRRDNPFTGCVKVDRPNGSRVSGQDGRRERRRDLGGFGNHT